MCRRPTLVFRPLTPARWPDLVHLFGPRGACAGCWCMWWRRPHAAWTRAKGAGNRRAFKRVVDTGPPPGILAYADGEPVGWVAVAPRDAYLRFARSRVLAPVDAQPVWAVTCFFVARAWRGRGLTVGLLEAAAAFARRRGGGLLEGYPVATTRRRTAPVFVYTGVVSTFARARFREVARRSPTRLIMRRALRPGGGRRG